MTPTRETTHITLDRFLVGLAIGFFWAVVGAALGNHSVQRRFKEVIEGFQSSVLFQVVVGVWIAVIGMYLVRSLRRYRVTVAFQLVPFAASLQIVPR